MPTDLLGRRGRGLHHGQKRKLHQQAEYIAADQPFSLSFSLAIGRRTIHCYGEGVLNSERRGAGCGKKSVRPEGGVS